MIKTNAMPLRMVIETQYSVDAEKVIMMIQAIMICRNGELRDCYDYNELPQVVYDFENKNGAKYYVSAEEITVEFMEVAGEFQEELPCEIYFENHGNSRFGAEDDDGEIEDYAVCLLAYEEPHDRHLKISA